MLSETLIKLFKRDLNKLKSEIRSYRDEKNLWLVTKEISNSAGNLCLHIVGNLNTFIGAEFGNTGYVRQRNLEFSLKDIPRINLIKQIDETILVVENAIMTLSEVDFQKEYFILYIGRWRKESA